MSKNELPAIAEHLILTKNDKQCPSNIFIDSLKFSSSVSKFDIAEAPIYN